MTLFHDYWEGQVHGYHRYNLEEKLELEVRSFLLFIPKGGSLVDIGCGSCQLTTYFSPYFDKILGVDFSESMLESGRSRILSLGNNNIVLKNGSALCVPAEDHGFDVVFSSGMVQYLNDLELVKHLEECIRILKPGGIIFIANSPDVVLKWPWLMRKFETKERNKFVQFARNIFVFFRENYQTIMCRNSSFGYWQSRRSFQAMAKNLGLEVEFFNSIFYEYRFHAVLRRK